MEIWPSELPNPIYPLDHDTEDPTIRTPYEDGSLQTRARFTRMRKTFVLRWSSLTQEEFNILEFFLEKIKIGSTEFEWIHPKTGAIYEVKIIAKTPFALTEYGYSGELTFYGVKKNA